MMIDNKQKRSQLCLDEVINIKVQKLATNAISDVTINFYTNTVLKLKS